MCITTSLRQEVAAKFITLPRTDLSSPTTTTETLFLLIKFFVLFLFFYFCFVLLQTTWYEVAL